MRSTEEKGTETRGTRQAIRSLGGGRIRIARAVPPGIMTHLHMPGSSAGLWAGLSPDVRVPRVPSQRTSDGDGRLWRRANRRRRLLPGSGDGVTLNTTNNF